MDMTSLTSEESQKTAGGIRKSLLTPCRRVGLSRNRKFSNSSPFVSPLSSIKCNDLVREVQKSQLNVKLLENGDVYSNQSDIKLTKTTSEVTSPKRKKSKIMLCENEPNTSLRLERNVSCTSSEIRGDTQTEDKLTISSINDENISKPLFIKNNVSARRKKSRVILNNIDKQVSDNTLIDLKKEIPTDNKKEMLVDNNKEILDKTKDMPIDHKKEMPIDNKTENLENKKKEMSIENKEVVVDNRKQLSVSNKTEMNGANKEVMFSTNENEIPIDNNKIAQENLTKKCLIVIEKTLFNKSNTEIIKNMELTESDSDDITLSDLSKQLKENNIINKPTQLIDDDEDFCESKLNINTKVKKLEDKKTSTTDLKKQTIKNKRICKRTKTTTMKVQNKSSQSSASLDDDDFEIDCRKTFIQKAYGKVAKPLKAKSTGSITQKDIDNLKARIDIKRKLLLAKSYSKETDELRYLIKKWRKGCQDALMELMDLMRKKVPDKQDMDFSELLQMLKIPAQLVGYDEDNESFVSPDVGVYC